jgi:hypothetical protein
LPSGDGDTAAGAWDPKPNMNQLLAAVKTSSVPTPVCPRTRFQQ